MALFEVLAVTIAVEQCGWTVLHVAYAAVLATIVGMTVMSTGFPLSMLSSQTVQPSAFTAMAISTFLLMLCPLLVGQSTVLSSGLLYVAVGLMYVAAFPLAYVSAIANVTSRAAVNGDCLQQQQQQTVHGMVWVAESLPGCVLPLLQLNSANIWMFSLSAVVIVSMATMFRLFYTKRQSTAYMSCN